MPRKVSVAGRFSKHTVAAHVVSALLPFSGSALWADYSSVAGILEIHNSFAGS